MSNNISKFLEISLTRSCNYNCSWCNQRYDLTKPMYNMRDSARRIFKNTLRSGQEWIEGLNSNPGKSEYDRLVFSGGEPSLHPDFFDIVSKVKDYRSVIVVTNLSFDISKLINACRDSNSHVIVQPSFHFEFVAFEPFVKKMKALDKYHLLSNFIPVSIVDLPDRKEPRDYKKKFKQEGYTASIYKFEGYYDGKFIYSDVKGFGSLGECRSVSCSSSVNFACPNGDVVFCPSDTYSNEVKTYGNICDKISTVVPDQRNCDRYGACHISAASWVRVKSLETGEVIWKGKSFLRKTPLILLRIYCERKNYKWLSGIKGLLHTLSLIGEKFKNGIFNLGL